MMRLIVVSKVLSVKGIGAASPMVTEPVSSLAVPSTTISQRSFATSTTSSA